MNDELRNCRLCPRRCGADRAAGERGFCGAGASARIARAALHFWEEPCISGENGSGAVFFSGCTMRCVYCQNYELSAHGLGYDITDDELASEYLRLQKEGAANINLITATQYIPQAAASVAAARKRGLSVPVVYNTSGYELERSLEMLDGTADIYLPDLKYMKNETAEKYSLAADYPEIAKKALDIMFEQVGEPVFENGMMKRGMIIRHLMLPGHLSETIKVINYVHARFGDRVWFSLMSQYTPLRKFGRFPELNRTIDRKCYQAAVEHCMKLDMRSVFIQEGTAADESFIPEFFGEPGRAAKKTDENDGRKR